MPTSDRLKSVPPRATAALRTESWAQRRSSAQAWAPTNSRAVFVVPHPDDEVLVMGGLLQLTVAAAAVDVIVVAVTNGEAAYGPHEQAELGRLRCREQEEALTRLSPKKQLKVVRLGLPDSGVENHEQTVADAVSELAEPDDLIVAPWRHDHHSDHEACGRAAHVAARNRRCDLAEGLFWAWQHPPRSPSRPLRRLVLSISEVRNRQAALDAHCSQLRPAPPRRAVLSETDLAPMRWSDEYYFVTRLTHR